MTNDDKIISALDIFIALVIVGNIYVWSVAAIRYNHLLQLRKQAQTRVIHLQVD